MNSNENVEWNDIKKIMVPFEESKVFQWLEETAGAGDECAKIYVKNWKNWRNLEPVKDVEIAWFKVAFQYYKDGNLEKAVEVFATLAKLGHEDSLTMLDSFLNEGKVIMQVNEKEHTVTLVVNQ